MRVGLTPIQSTTTQLGAPSSRFSRVDALTSTDTRHRYEEFGGGESISKNRLDKTQTKEREHTRRKSTAVRSCLNELRAIQPLSVKQNHRRCHVCYRSAPKREWVPPMLYENHTHNCIDMRGSGTAAFDDLLPLVSPSGLRRHT